MSSRPQFDPYEVITAGDMSADILSKVTIIQKLSLLSYGISWTGSSPIGSMSVQVSNDYEMNQDGSVKVAGTWNDLPLSASTAVSGNSGNGFIDVFATGGYAMRLKYTKGSGTGSLDAIVTGKVA